MKVISKANNSILTILSGFRQYGVCNRWSQFCIKTTVAEGVLIFNMLTRELILLDQKEYAQYTELEYLHKHWFLISENVKEKDLADYLRFVLANRQTNDPEITSYTIFTTTDCNARCFYCFELGGSHVTMSPETAEKVVRYIKIHSGDKKVNIGWFGGEPLLNTKAIDTIAQGLQREGIKFSSHMISNGYLFDADTIYKAVSSWKLNKVQITLDGTESIYNRIKAYTYQNTNPFEIVMNNISCLLDANIRVSIRLNIGLHNAEDLLLLANELSYRFRGMTGISVYTHYLFRRNISDAQLYSDEKWESLEIAMQQLNDALEIYGLLPHKGIPKNIKFNHCMADSGSAITILPDGHVGLCEHYTDSEFVGHIDQGYIDATMAESWKEKMPEIPECAGCFYYLDCIRLKKCHNTRECHEVFRRQRLTSVRKAMQYEYVEWKKTIETGQGADNEYL